MKRLGPGQPPSRHLRGDARPDRRARHPLAGGRSHRRGGGLDPAVRPPAQHLPPGHRSPGGPGHLDRGAPGQHRRPSGSPGRHRVDGEHGATVRYATTWPPWSSASRAACPSMPRCYTFAGELGDAAVDEAIAPLILASRFGGSDLQSLLATAAANTRDQIALWQRTEIARAKPRRDMRLVIAVTLVFTVGVLLDRPRLLQAVRHPGRPDRPAGRGRSLRRRLRGHEPALASPAHAPPVRQPFRLRHAVRPAGLRETRPHVRRDASARSGPDRSRRSSMVVIILVGLGVGVGLAAIVWGLFPPPLTLRAALARLSGEHVTAPTDVLTQGVGGARRLCGHLLEVNVRQGPQLADIVLPDLAITGTPTETFAVKVVGYAIGLALLGPVLWAASGAVGVHLGVRAPRLRGPGPRCSRSGHPVRRPPPGRRTAPARTSATRSPPTPRWCRWPWPGPWGGRAPWRWPPPCRPPTGPWPRSPRACCGPRPTGNNRGKASSGWPSASTFPTSPTWPGPCPRPVTERASATPWRRRPTRSGSRRPAALEDSAQAVTQKMLLPGVLLMAGYGLLIFYPALASFTGARL